MMLEIRGSGKLIVAIIKPEEANLSNADKFKEEVFKQIDEGNKMIALDFRNVTYVDSSFLGAMVASLKHALSVGADIYLTQLKPDISNMLHLIRMDRVFKIYAHDKDIPEAK